MQRRVSSLAPIKVKEELPDRISILRGIVASKGNSRLCGEVEGLCEKVEGLCKEVEGSCGEVRIVRQAMRAPTARQTTDYKRSTRLSRPLDRAKQVETAGDKYPFHTDNEGVRGRGELQTAPHFFEECVQRVSGA